MSADYRQFLEGKVHFDHACGFEIDPAEINGTLFPFQRDVVAWAIRGGRRALFEAFGLGKTRQQIEICRIVRERAKGPGLIVLPLGVRQEFVRDGAALGVDLQFIRANAEMSAGHELYLTNYESVLAGKIDPAKFVVASLDEAAVLRSYGSKTYQEFLPLFSSVPYRFVATATPDPNRHKELIHYAGFLGIMDTGQALTRFFQRDSEKAGNLTLYPHKEQEFWLWVHSWALFLRKPSDLGYSDEGYDLPPLTVRYHEVQVDHGGAGADREGQSLLFRNAALGVTDAAREKRDTLPARIAKMVEIRTAEPDAHFLIWHDLEAEREAIEDVLPVAVYDSWCEFKDGHPAALALYDRHYSARELPDRKLFLGPGEKTVLLTRDQRALFGWRKHIDDSGQTGVNCAVFRNEGHIRSSDLIREAMAIAWLRWPGQRLYTFVDPDEVESSNPGYCFLAAGWSECGWTPKGLRILEALPTVEVSAISATPGLRSVFGSQDLDARERNVIDFSDGKITDLATKPELSGAGPNFQRHCHRAIFTGIGYKFHDFVQAVHRIHRFLQAQPCVIDIIYAESEREILRSLQTKWTQHNEQLERMAAIVREYGLNHLSMEAALTRSIGLERKEAKGQAFAAVNNDCVEECRRMESDTMDLICTSIPFSNHYEYTPSYNDFGHTEGDEHFFRQMDFLTPELLRVLRPGRIAAIHVKDRILFGSVTGLGTPTVNPFHAKCIAHYQRHGFAYMGMITVVTDVVRENNQTYRLGWSEQCKDGSKMGVGSPEYVLILRKLPTDRSRAYADEPVRKSKDEYTRARWQIDAHAFWRSSGNRLLTADELAGYGPDKLAKLYTQHSLQGVYDHEAHVAIGEALEARNALPATFMSIAPGSHDADVWHDVNRMRTLNGEQSRRGLENHICPLQFDIVDRLIRRYTNEGDTVLDPFGGLMTVPVRAVKLGRRGVGIELNAQYWADGVRYLQAAEREASIPDLFAAEELRA